MFFLEQRDAICPLAPRKVWGTLYVEKRVKNFLSEDTMFGYDDCSLYECSWSLGEWTGSGRYSVSPLVRGYLLKQVWVAGKGYSASGTVESLVSLECGKEIIRLAEQDWQSVSLDCVLAIV